MASFVCRSSYTVTVDDWRRTVKIVVGNLSTSHPWNIYVHSSLSAAPRPMQRWLCSEANTKKALASVPPSRKKLPTTVNTSSFYSCGELQHMPECVISCWTLSMISYRSQMHFYCLHIYIKCNMYYFIWCFCNNIPCWYKRVLLRSEKKLASRKAWRLRASHTLSNRQPIKLSSSAKNGIKPMQGIKIGIKPMQSLSNRQPIKLSSSAKNGV